MVRTIQVVPIMISWIKFHMEKSSHRISIITPQCPTDWFLDTTIWYEPWRCLNPWWRHQIETFSRYSPFVRGIHRSSVNSPHTGQWSGAMFSLICAWINGWVNNHEAGDFRRHRAHYGVIITHFRSEDGFVRCRRLCILNTRSITKHNTKDAKLTIGN